VSRWCALSGARGEIAGYLAKYAGLRPQEALALQWGDVRVRTLLIHEGRSVIYVRASSDTTRG
jgi:integrase